MLTGHEDLEIVRQAFAAGADGFCVKSILGEQLINAINCVSIGAVWLSPSVSSQLKMSLISQRTLPAIASNTTHEALSKRESEVLQLLVDGLTNKEIASRLFLSTETVKTHVRHIYEKLRVKQRTGAAIEAIKRGLVTAA